MTDKPLTLTAIRLLQSDNECPDTVYIPDTVYQAIPYPDNHTRIENVIKNDIINCIKEE